MMNSNQIGSEPGLGIFWLVKNKLLIDSVELSQSEQYYDYRNCPHSHIDIWEQWQRIGKAPLESPYEEYPRGRVTYDTKTKIFMLLGDKCLLKRQDLIAKIKEELHLPNKIALQGDSHYRCFNCLNEDEE
jgi:hypothetical protein